MEVFHDKEIEYKQKMVQESIKTEYLPSTAYLSERDDTEQLFLMNHNNQR